MCGRFVLSSPPEAVAALFGVDQVPDWQPRYNIAPTQAVPACRQPAPELREVRPLVWGLIPHWAKERAIGHRLINARVETVDRKPAFRAAVRHRRCLVPADGYYEWQRRADGTRQPWYVRRRDGGLMAMAGLWEHWRDPDSGEVIETFTLITTDASPRLAWLHGRMPALVARRDFDRWLDPGEHRPGHVLPLLHAPDDALFESWPVSRHVNDPRNDDPQCVRPITAEAS